MTKVSTLIDLPPLWTHSDIDLLNASRDFEHIGQITLSVLKRSSKRVTMLSGPISTGGTGSKEENLARYRRASQFLELHQGRRVFNQLPSEDAVVRHFEAWRRSLDAREARSEERGSVGRIELQEDEPYCWELLEGIYAPLFHSGHVELLMFMPNWTTSRGSRWEHDMACCLGIPIGHMPSDWETQM